MTEIHNDSEHQAALAEIERLWDAKPGSPELERLTDLAVAVDAFEKVRYPIPAPSTEAAAAFRKDQE